jgi:anthranilate phosphoribosyltransferase
VIEVKDGGTEEWFTEPGQFGLAEASVDQITGGEPQDSAATIRSVLEGADGPARDVVLLNAGAAIFVGGRAEDLGAGVERAREAIDSGSASTVLEGLVARTRELAA